MVVTTINDAKDYTSNDEQVLNCPRLLRRDSWKRIIMRYEVTVATRCTAERYEWLMIYSSVNAYRCRLQSKDPHATIHWFISDYFIPRVLGDIVCGWKSRTGLSTDRFDWWNSMNDWRHWRVRKGSWEDYQVVVTIAGMILSPRTLEVESINIWKCWWVSKYR